MSGDRAALAYEMADPDAKAATAWGCRTTYDQVHQLPNGTSVAYRSRDVPGLVAELVQARHELAELRRQIADGELLSAEDTQDRVDEAQMGEDW